MARKSAARLVVLTNVVVFLAELWAFVSMPVAIASGSTWAKLLSLVASAGLLVVATHENVAEKPPRHVWTVLLAVIAVGAAVLALGTSRRRAVDIVGFAGMVANATISILVRRRPAA